jgi:hypothetical protein
MCEAIGVFPAFALSHRLIPDRDAELSSEMENANADVS